MLLAFVILGMGLWELLVVGSSEGWQTLSVGTVILLVGFFASSWDVWRGKSAVIDPLEVEGNLAEIHTREAREKAEDTQASAIGTEPEEMRFTIHQTGDDAALDRAQAILQNEPRIISMRSWTKCACSCRVGCQTPIIAS